MGDELSEALEALSHAKAEQAEMTIEVPAQPPGHDMVAPQRDIAADAAFADDETEASIVAGWMAMWGGSLLLNDIEKTRDEPEEESRDKREPKRRKCC